ncbi:MAG TPA: hypothetical protein VF580_02010 [Thermoanaerobaculia bacterium]
MASRSPIISPGSPVLVGLPWLHAHGIPWSRAAALRKWRTALVWIVAAQAGVTLVKVFLDLVTETGDAWSGLLSIGEAALLAAVLVLMTRHAEGKLLSRPPKSLLGWQLGAFVSMAIWETGLSLLHPSADWLGDTHFLIGHALAGISFLLVAGWLIGAKLMLAGIDDDRTF